MATNDLAKALAVEENQPASFKTLVNTINQAVEIFNNLPSQGSYSFNWTELNNATSNNLINADLFFKSGTGIASQIDYLITTYQSSTCSANYSGYNSTKRNSVNNTQYGTVKKSKNSSQKQTNYGPHYN